MPADFSQLEEKYGVPSQPSPPAIREDDLDQNPATVPSEKEIPLWKQSEPVRLLSIFVKEFRDEGFSLELTREGNPRLCINPGLRSPEEQPDRWDMADYGYQLLARAASDLKTMIAAGHITLPQNYWI